MGVISWAFTAQLISAFVCSYAKSRFSHNPAEFKYKAFISETDKPPHEAGYDAFMCGFGKLDICFYCFYGNLKQQSLKNLSMGFPTRANTKMGCRTTEDGYSLEILDIGSIGIVLSM